MRIRGSVAGCLLLCTAVLNAQEQEIEIASSEIVPGLYTIYSANEVFIGGNMGLSIGADGVVLIDDGVEMVGSALLEAIAELTGDPVDIVLNTHYHGDHVGSNAALQAQGATIIAHDNIRKRMLEGSGGQEYPANALPVVTYADGVVVHLNGMAMQAIHVEQAHTDGDSIIVMPDVNVLFTGDILFNGIFPFIDLAGGGTVDGFLTALDTIIAAADSDTKIISGHGPAITDRAAVQRARDMLADSQSRVKALVDAGQTEEDIVAENPLADYESWSWGFITTERMTRTLVQSMTQ